MDTGASKDNGAAQLKYARQHWPLVALMACWVVSSVVPFIVSIGAIHKQWEQGAVLIIGLFLISLIMIHVFKILRHTVQVEQLMAEITKRNELINVEIKGRKKLEGQLIQSQKMEAIGRLAGGIAHDFNNIITVIRGYSDLLANSLGPNDPKRSDIEEIRKAAERGGGLTAQLLAFSRQQPFDPIVIDVNELILRADKMTNRVLGEDINVITIYGRNLAMVKVDPGQLEQVVLNLTINARDAMPKGGQLTIETANVSLTDDYIFQRGGEMKAGEYVLLTISDTGVGMSEEVKKHIFEPFFTTKEEGKGTGLGLATCYGLVKRAGGFISVYSEAGNGTIVKIFLPSVEAAPYALKGLKKSQRPPKGTETVLLVEDEKAVRDLSARVLSQYGYTVIEGINGEDAMHLAEKNKGKDIRLLFTDLVMPQMGGKELAGHLKTFFPNIKVLFTSGYSDRDVVSQGLLEQNTAFIQKPFSPQILLEKVREVLG